ncbi:MAG TPA: hypothetical protein VIM11_17505 [Tepidisphaeraceae bacterium]|jgi:hypothetical protein
MAKRAAFAPDQSIDNPADGRFRPARSLEEVRVEMEKRGVRLTRQGVEYVLKRAEAKIKQRLRDEWYQR